MEPLLAASVPSHRQLELAAVLSQEEERTAELLRLRQCLSDYESLASSLKTLPAQVERPAMMPFGKLALFKGALRHTNEVTVPLGHNHFALRSATQASEVARRRADFVREEVQRVDAEINSLLRRRATLEEARSMLDEDELRLDDVLGTSEASRARGGAVAAMPLSHGGAVPSSGCAGEAPAEAATNYEQLRRELNKIKLRRAARGAPNHTLTTQMPQSQQLLSPGSAFSQRVVERPSTDAPKLPVAFPPYSMYWAESHVEGSPHGAQSKEAPLEDTKAPSELVEKLALRSVDTMDSAAEKEPREEARRVSRFKAARLQGMANESY